jgi:plastocyanin
MVRRLLLVVALIGAMSLVPPSALAGGGCHAGPAGKMTSSGDAEVTIAQCAFQDTVVYVERGERVTWSNEDPVPHTVTGAMGSWGDTEYLADGDEVSYRFGKRGVFPYYCELHPAMVGAIVVGEAKAMRGTSTDGIEKIDLTAATVPDEAPPPDSDGGSAFVPAAAVALAVAAGAGLLFVRKRRSHAPSPAA